MGLVLCSLCLAVVRTIAGLNALQSAHETNQVSFAVAGRVLATTARGNFTLEDASGRTFIYNSTPADKRINPVAGDRISAYGAVIFESDGFVCFCASKISKSGHEDPGQPFEVTAEDIVDGRCDYQLVRLTGRVTGFAAGTAACFTSAFSSTVAHPITDAATAAPISIFFTFIPCCPFYLKLET